MGVGGSDVAVFVGAGGTVAAGSVAVTGGNDVADGSGVAVAGRGVCVGMTAVAGCTVSVTDGAGGVAVWPMLVVVGLAGMAVADGVGVRGAVVPGKTVAPGWLLVGRSRGGTVGVAAGRLTIGVTAVGDGGRS